MNKAGHIKMARHLMAEINGLIPRQKQFADAETDYSRGGVFRVGLRHKRGILDAVIMWADRLRC